MATLELSARVVDDVHMLPTADRFRGLARSSPWRWETLRFQMAWKGRDHLPVQAWVRRPDGVRVESLDGGLIVAETQAPQPMGALLSSDGTGQFVPPLAAAGVVPHLDDDGFVTGRPVDHIADDPFYLDYLWVAMLDPVELADPDSGDSADEPVDIDQLREVDHHGRPAWEATLRPTRWYRPRCPCCALLFSEGPEAELGVPTARDRDASFRYPDAHRVRLDVATGVCVLTEEIGGSRPGSGHELIIDAVDQIMDDQLFVAPPQPGPFRRLLGRHTQ